MKVSYITMRFPVPSETFAGRDIRALVDGGVDVSVHTMRAPRHDASRLLDERRLAGLSVSHGTLAENVTGLVSCVSRPLCVARLLFWLFRCTWCQPTQLLASLVLVPRSVGILRSLERERPDVVHLFWGHYPSLVGFLALRHLPDSVLSMFVGAYDLTRAYGGTGCVGRRADVVWTHARWNVPAIQALRVPRERIHVVYRGIDASLFSGKRGSKIKHRIATAGRLIAEKGMDDVLAIFREILAKWPAATLVILGEGSDRARLERMSMSWGIAEAVRFTGHLSEGDVAAELAAAEIFVLMSRKESERLPNVVKEAMASGCLCIVTDTPAIDELLRDQQHGFVVRRGDTDAAIAHIDAVFGERCDVRSLLSAAAEHIAKYFDVSQSMAEYKRQWRYAIAQRSHHPRTNRLCDGPGRDGVPPEMTVGESSSGFNR